MNVILFTFAIVAGFQQEAFAQSPVQTAINEVIFAGTWRIIAERGDADDYWLVFDRPGGVERFKSEDDEIDRTINENDSWKLRLELEEHPEDCEASCDPAPIRSLRQDAGVATAGDSRFLHLATQTTMSCSSSICSSRLYRRHPHYLPCS